ncbi:FkbM family methyltransferase [Spirosoma rigui]|uniref:FkbM family methyltransferase n=1 Tax=Spirosoma rigui TaxID=564064 RepID=UPI0014755FEF|nr:FkbM family methyltransferase [Spirosoma rigui]
MKGFLKRIARRFGYDILHLPTDPITRQWLDLMHDNQIDLVFDVGANVGQYGGRIRSLGYRGDIVSFEPMAEAYQQLHQQAVADPHWQTVHTGMGDYDGNAVINVSTNSYSSSILEMLPLHLDSAPEAAHVRKESIRIQRLDSLVDQFYKPGRNLYVKIDTQGFERQVFEGSRRALDKIRGIQMELSLQPLYRGETLMTDMVSLLRTEGYTLKLIEGGHRNYETGELLQVEGYFFR